MNEGILRLERNTLSADATAEHVGNLINRQFHPPQTSKTRVTHKKWGEGISSLR